MNLSSGSEQGPTKKPRLLKSYDDILKKTSKTLSATKIAAPKSKHLTTNTTKKADRNTAAPRRASPKKASRVEPNSSKKGDGKKTSLKQDMPEAIAAIPGGDDAIVDSPAKSDSKKKGHGIFEHNFQDSFDAEREELMEDLS